MAITIFEKKHTRLRIKKRILPKSKGVLGDLLMATELPEGHCSCSKCDGYKFEVFGYAGGSKLEMGCVHCGNRLYLMFPVDIQLPAGRFVCKKHPDKAMIIIHNMKVISVGCECCKTEININVDITNNLILAH